MSYLYPTPEQSKAFFQHATSEPFRMLNLLKFKPLVDGTDCTGAEQYRMYMQAVTPFVQAAGGQVIYSGSAHLTLIGPTAEWDKVVIVEYPSKESFLTMSQQPDFPHAMRTAALEDSRLILCD